MELNKITQAKDIDFGWIKENVGKDVAYEIEKFFKEKIHSIEEQDIVWDGYYKGFETYTFILRSQNIFGVLYYDKESDIMEHTTITLDQLELMQKMLKK